MQQGDKADRAKSIQDRRETIEEMSKHLLELIERRDSLNNDRKEEWKKQAELEKLLSGAKEAMSKTQRDLLSTTNRTLSDFALALTRIYRAFTPGH